MLNEELIKNCIAKDRKAQRELYEFCYPILARVAFRYHDNEEDKQEIIDELSVIRHKPRESMANKVELISKLEMKKILSYSPDIADAMAYGIIFHLKKTTMSASNFVFLNY